MSLKRWHRAAIGGAAAAAIAIATPFVAGKEGVVYHVYRDVVGVPTYCYGQTSDPRWGHRYTPEECEADLRQTINKFDREIRGCLTRELPAKTEAASISFAYNLGAGTFCKYIAPDFNSGQMERGCEHMTHFNHAGGRVVRGLTIRRGEERDLCLDGVRGN